MESRTLGRTNLTVSLLGFGCGAVGGLMVRGEPAEQERVVARALELGVTFFDTAPLYGNGASETNLGRVLARLRPEIVLATKFALDIPPSGSVATVVRASLEASLRRLGRESVDIIQCHNLVGTPTVGGRELEPDVVLDEVVPTLELLRSEGKVRYFGITGLGTTHALQRVVDSGAIDTVQIVYNLLNTSAARGDPGPGGQDFEGLAVRAATAGMGRIGIRPLAGGALSGIADRHPLGMPDVAPIATGPDYAADVAGAGRFARLVRSGHAGSMVEAALRFAITGETLSTVLVGFSDMEHLEAAATAIQAGPLSNSALIEVGAIQHALPTVPPSA